MKDVIGVHRPLFNEHFGHHVTRVTVCASCKSSLHGQKENKEIVNYTSFPNGIRVVLLVQRIIQLHINSNFYEHQGFEVFASIRPKNGKSTYMYCSHVHELTFVFSFSLVY